MIDTTLMLLVNDRPPLLPLVSYMKESNTWVDDFLSDETDLKQHQSTKQRTTYVKDCTRCRSLTKNCLYTCVNRVPFPHFAETDNYITIYRLNLSSIAKKEGEILEDMIATERKAKAEEFRSEFSRNPPISLENTTLKKNDISATIRPKTSLAVEGVSLAIVNLNNHKYTGVRKTQSCKTVKRRPLSVKLKP